MNRERPRVDVAPLSDSIFAYASMPAKRSRKMTLVAAKTPVLQTGYDFH